MFLSYHHTQFSIHDIASDENILGKLENSINDGTWWWFAGLKIFFLLVVTCTWEEQSGNKFSGLLLQQSFSMSFNHEISQWNFFQSCDKVNIFHFSCFTCFIWKKFEGCWENFYLWEKYVISQKASWLWYKSPVRSDGTKSFAWAFPRMGILCRWVVSLKTYTRKISFQLNGKSICSIEYTE